MEEPFEPEPRRLYWLYPPLLDAGDEEANRPAVVLIVSTMGAGEIFVVWRSSTEKNGYEHEAHSEVGLKKGWFSRSRTIDPELWTPDKARSIDLLLDEEAFARVWNDHVREERP